MQSPINIVLPEQVIVESQTMTLYKVKNSPKWCVTEDSARYTGCTHNYCECGAIKEKYIAYCDDCSLKRKTIRYNELPEVKWDQKSPIYEDLSDKYFQGLDDLEEWIDENQVENYLIYPTIPDYLPELDWNNIELPEDCDNLFDIVDEKHPIFVKLDEINEMRKEIIISYSPNKTKRLVF